MDIGVAVVGCCASGKSSVVAALRQSGTNAWSVAQEHSAIAELWRHLSPDRLVYLDVSLETLRRRRNNDRWPSWIYDVQHERLTNARQHADVVIQTDALTVDQIVEIIRRELRLDESA